MYDYVYCCFSSILTTFQMCHVKCSQGQGDRHQLTVQAGRECDGWGQGLLRHPGGQQRCLGGGDQEGLQETRSQVAPRQEQGIQFQ